MMEDALGIFSQILGYCFSAAMGPGLTDTHCFTSVYDGAHVRDVHVVSQDGAPVYQGETLYSNAPGGLVFVYINSDGGFGTGKGRVQGNVMSYDMTMRATAEAKDKPLTGSWRIREDGFDAEAPGEPLRRYLPER